MLICVNLIIFSPVFLGLLNGISLYHRNLNTKIYQDPDVADSLEYQQPKRKGRARYILAKKYFDVKEYSRLVRRINIHVSGWLKQTHIICIWFHRCAHYTQECTDPVSLFLHYYSRYMAGEKTIVEDESDKSSNSI